MRARKTNAAAVCGTWLQCSRYAEYAKAQFSNAVVCNNEKEQKKMFMCCKSDSAGRSVNSSDQQTHAEADCIETILPCAIFTCAALAYDNKSVARIGFGGFGVCRQGG